MIVLLVPTAIQRKAQHLSIQYKDQKGQPDTHAEEKEVATRRDR
jgi:hypothetical protein